MNGNGGEREVSDDTSQPHRLCNILDEPPVIPIYSSRSKVLLMRTGSESLVANNPNKPNYSPSVKS